MTITFENDNDVIVYTLEKMIAYARNNQYIFVAQCVWWLVSVIGLQSGLVTYIDYLRIRSEVANKEITESSELSKTTPEESNTSFVHSDRIQNIQNIRAISSTPWDLAEDQRLDKVLDSAEQFVGNSAQARNNLRLGRINPLASTKKQFKIQKNKKPQQLSKKEKRRLNHLTQHSPNQVRDTLLR